MNAETVAKQFIVGDEWVRQRLEAITTKLLKYCVIDKAGQVHVSDRSLTSKQRVMLVLSARLVASQLDPEISGDVTVDEMAKATGLPENQVRARGNDWVALKFAESPKRGVFRAVQYKIDDFVDGLTKGAGINDH
jgi:hypothetical protein